MAARWQQVPCTAAEAGCRPESLATSSSSSSSDIFGRLLLVGAPEPRSGRPGSREPLGRFEGRGLGGAEEVLSATTSDDTGHGWDTIGGIPRTRPASLCWRGDRCEAGGRAKGWPATATACEWRREPTNSGRGRNLSRQRSRSTWPKSTRTRMRAGLPQLSSADGGAARSTTLPILS